MPQLFREFSQNLSEQNSQVFEHKWQNESEQCGQDKI
jgi:hypothetical protein